jgi:large subunit ribosomal protein L23
VNKERILTILQSPHSSEKAFANEQQYVFKVLQTANKLEIKKAIENLFEVIVEKVRVVNVKGKARRFGQINGRRKSWKKAYVKLAEGSSIDLADTSS